MAYEIVLSAAANREMEETVDWYNDRRDGLGERFIEALDNRLLLLSETPDIFPIKSDGYREILFEKFPYLVVYRIIQKKKKVRILHIFHTSRNPDSKSRE